MSTSKIKRKVHIHKINKEYLPIYNNSHICQIKENIDRYIKSKGLNTLIELKSTSSGQSGVCMEFTKYNSQYLFGSLGKMVDFERNPLVRSRSKNDIKDKKPIEMMDNYIEHFTYFCIDLNSYFCAVIHNNNTPSFRMHFQNFLFSEIHLGLNKYYKRIEIIDRLADDIGSEVNKLGAIVKINAKYTQDHISSRGHLSLKELNDIDEDLIKEANTTIIFNTNKDTSGIKTIFSNITNPQKNYKKLEITDEEGIVVDMIKNLVIKKVSLDLSNDSLSDTDIVFDALVNVLRTL